MRRQYNGTNSIPEDKAESDSRRRQTARGLVRLPRINRASFGGTFHRYPASERWIGLDEKHARHGTHTTSSRPNGRHSLHDLFSYSLFRAWDVLHG